MAVAAVVVVAGGAVAGWRAGWPPALFGSSKSGQQLGPQIRVGQIGSRSATPYQVGSNEFVSNLAAWNSLPSASRAALVGQLHVAEQRFEALGRNVFPPGSLTVREVAARGVGGSAAPRGTVLTAARSESAPGVVSEDFGATAFGDRSFDYAKAVYAGASGQWSWTPCATGPSTLPGTAEVTICGGQSFGVTGHLPGAGMTTSAVTVNGDGAALAAQPVIATFTNRTGHAARVTVSGTAASVTVSLRTSVISAACNPDSLLYSSPAPGNPASHPQDRSLISLTDCLGTLDAIAPIGKALKVISALRNWADFARDAYSSVANVQQLRSSSALLACASGQMLSYIAAVLAPVGVPSPSCTPTPLPTWTGTVPAGKTVQFITTLIVEEHFVGNGEGTAALFSFIHLHVTESPTGASGGSPGGPGPATAYVVSNGDGTVTPINLASGTPGTPITVGNKPTAIAITPDGATAYVTNSGAGTVTPINLATGIPGTPIHAGKFPVAIAIAPDGATAYVVNNDDGTVTPINLASGTPGTPITVGNTPTAIAITPDGATAYVTNSGAGTVTPINLATGTPSTPIHVGNGPASVVIAPDGKTAYVANNDDGTVTPISLPAGSPRTPITVGNSTMPVVGSAYEIAIAPDGRTAYVLNNADGTVIPINLATGTLGTPIHVGNTPYKIAITPDGKTAYVTNGGDGTITPINLATGITGTPIHVGNTPDGIAITP